MRCRVVRTLGWPNGAAPPYRPSLVHPSPCTRAFCSGWLDFLKEVRQQVGQVALLTCPTDRIRRENQQEGRKVVEERNRLLRAMVASQRGGSAAAEPGAAGSGAGASGSGARRLRIGGSGGGSGGSDATVHGIAAPLEAPSAGQPLLLVDVDALTQHLPPGLAVAPTD